MKRNFCPALILGVSLFSSFAHPGTAQQLCGARDAVLNRLSTQYGETRRSMGLGANNGVVEIFASEETGTWTITITLPDGRMCLVAAGDSYEDTMDPLKTSGIGI